MGENDKCLSGRETVEYLGATDRGCSKRATQVIAGFDGDAAFDDRLAQRGGLAAGIPVASEMRRMRDDEMRRPRLALIRRWATALIFALVSAAAAGVGYGWWARPYQGAALRSQMDFAESVQHLVMKMTPAE
jgi:hypothetical protein